MSLHPRTGAFKLAVALGAALAMAACAKNPGLTVSLAAMALRRLVRRRISARTSATAFSLKQI